MTDISKEAVDATIRAMKLEAELAQAIIDVWEARAEATAARLRAELDEAEARAEHWENVAIARDAKLQKAEAERDALQDHVTELLADQTCGCGHDHPTDVCLGHLPLHRKIVAERDAANALLREIADLTTQHGGAAQALKLIRAHLGAKT